MNWGDLPDDTAPRRVLRSNAMPERLIWIATSAEYWELVADIQAELGVEGSCDTTADVAKAQVAAYDELGGTFPPIGSALADAMTELAGEVPALGHLPSWQHAIELHAMFDRERARRGEVVGPAEVPAMGDAAFVTAEAVARCASARFVRRACRAMNAALVMIGSLMLADVHRRVLELEPNVDRLGADVGRMDDALTVASAMLRRRGA